ncbi:hypothetical protein [[Kitasatospora] papulosa]|uniref:hypothetical protein n=1 Tax=[Kitasatospora] papulosa TaxID=1464011 RepID=UPI0036BE2CEE
MSLYGNRPDPHHEPPLALWAWAAELDLLGRNAEHLPGRKHFAPSHYFATARQFRNNALTGALKLDGVPAMWEGFVLAPHILRLSESKGALHLAASDETEGRRVPLGETLEKALAVLYPALACAIADCTFGSDRRFGPAPRTGHPCARCRAWGSEHLPKSAAKA